MKKFVSPFALFLIVAAAISGCNASANGTAAPIESPSSSAAGNDTRTPAGLPKYGAPKVDSPLDGTSFKQDPCISLSLDQVKSLGLANATAGKRLTKEATDACQWVDTKTFTALTVGFTRGEQDGISAVYGNLKTGLVSFLEPTTVQGYPAAIAGLVDQRASGRCDIDVGVSDSLAVSIGYTGRTGEDGCAVAKKGADLLVSNLKKAGR